jgi:alkylation response protein AidB-like acyl-CoA dehydrogenase
VTDITEYVRGRTRSFGVAGRSEPARDDRVQIVLGGVASRVYGAEALVRDVARVFQRLRETDFADEQQRLDAYVRLQIHQFEAQQVIVDDIVHVTSDVFEVGGASAVSTKRGLDRHWRNARTLGSHNPAIFRRAYIGDWLLNGTQPETFFL